MALFELMARSQMYLGAGNIIGKGEQLTLNIHQMGVNRLNVLTNPESRRQAIQQFAVNGIDLKPNSPYLNAGHWDIKELPNRQFARAVAPEAVQLFGEQWTPWNDAPSFSETGIVDDVAMKKGCIDLVEDFFNEGLDLDYAEKGLEGRYEIVSAFYDQVKSLMGIDAELSFSPMDGNNLGAFNPDTNRIELNASYLEKADCKDLLNTILHESRHAFQDKCIATPESVTVKQNIIDVWKDNFDNYISPLDDFEAYANQEIEKDANYFANDVMEKGENYAFGYYG